MWNVLGGTRCFRLFLVDLVFFNLLLVVPVREQGCFLFYGLILCCFKWMVVEIEKVDLYRCMLFGVVFDRFRLCQCWLEFSLSSMTSSKLRLFQIVSGCFRLSFCKSIRLVFLCCMFLSCLEVDLGSDGVGLRLPKANSNR